MKYWKNVYEFINKMPKEKRYGFTLKGVIFNMTPELFIPDQKMTTLQKNPILQSCHFFLSKRPFGDDKKH